MSKKSKNNSLLNIDDYQDAPLFKALKELNEKLMQADTPPISLKVVGGFAMMCNETRDKSGVTDIDYIGPDLAREVEQIAEDIGRKHNLGAHWINNDILLSGSTLEDIEFSTGKLHFYPAFDLEKIAIDVLKSEDLLRMKVIAIDTSLTALDFGGEFTRTKDFADVKSLMKQLNIDISKLKELTGDYVYDAKTYDVIEEYTYNGLEGVNVMLDRFQKEEQENTNDLLLDYEEESEKHISMMDQMLNLAMQRINEEHNLGTEDITQ